MSIAKINNVKQILALLLPALLLSCKLQTSPIIPSVSPTFTASSPQTIISGRVHDENGDPIPNAAVRIQTGETFTTSAADGRFSLTINQDKTGAVKLTACATGYYCNGPFEAIAGQTDLELDLHPHAGEDNPAYTWLPSQNQSGQGEDQGCAACHSTQGAGLPYSMPVDEWLQDAHSGTVANQRFVTMYLGSDIHGNQSPPTRQGYNRDYGAFPLRPDPELPYFGPGYKLDFPDTAGNCAACHAPAAAVNNPYGVDPTQVSGVYAEGIPCDFCHKVWDVRLDPASGLPFANMPGVLSFELRRPPEGHQFFAGPYDDVAPGEDTYSPLQSQSQFCAPCHFGVFWDTLVYNSFGEWLSSPYNDPQSGKTCQECHMPPLGHTHFALPEQGGLERDPNSIFSHRMPGASDEQLLQNAVTLEASANAVGDTIRVTVTITNDQTGHHVPSDSPLRHLILLVEALDANGAPMALLDGPTLPDWCGVGDPAGGYYAGLPGTAYAKILEELWTEISPSGAYWNPTRLLSDNRLAAFTSDSRAFSFDMPDAGIGQVTVQLFYRRSFIELMDQKGWQVPDILMESITILLPNNTK